jgi:type I restriction enzyme S subunit
MEVKPASKLTETNKARNAWRGCDISDLCLLQRGFDITEATRKAGTIPVYSSSGLSYFHNEARLQPPAVITGRKGILGKVFYVEEPCWPHDTTLWVKDFKGNDPRFVHIFLGQFRLERFDAATSVPTLNRNNLVGIPIRLPQPPEQRAIAGALSDVDALLGALDQLIAKKRDLKQAAMQQLLTGQTRLPGFHGEWAVKRLGDAGKCLRGVSYSGDSDLSTHDTPCTKRLLRSNNVQDAVVVTDEVQFVNSARVSSHQLLKKDDILICMANGSKALVGKAGLFSVNDGFAYTFDAFMGCFRTDSTASNPAFVFYLFQTGRYRNYINNLLAGSSINNLRPSSIESLEFSIPPLPEQTAIAEVLTDLDAELAALEQRRAKTRALKQGMMQELLTGRTRLV